MRKQGVILKDGIEWPAMRRKGGNVTALEDDPALAGWHETSNHAQQRRLARARRANDRQKFAIAHSEINRLQHLQLLVAFSQPSQNEACIVTDISTS